jgi:hypothetical protein
MNNGDVKMQLKFGPFARGGTDPTTENTGEKLVWEQVGKFHMQPLDLAILEGIPVGRQAALKLWKRCGN